jgi:hypothetical protein
VPGQRTVHGSPLLEASLTWQGRELARTTGPHNQLEARWDLNPKGASFLCRPVCALFADCGHRPNSAEPRKRAENQCFGAYRACDTALSQPRSCKERDAAQEARNRPQFEQFGSRLSLVSFCSSSKVLIRWEFWLRGVDLNHRPLGYERGDHWLSSSKQGTSGNSEEP